MAGRFLEQIQRAREASQALPPEQANKPISEMSDEELEQAERAARRELLDARHQELRAREIARVSGAEGDAAPQAAGLADTLRGLQKRKRYWR